MLVDSFNLTVYKLKLYKTNKNYFIRLDKKKRKYQNLILNQNRAIS